jgi:cobalt-zinc-cadmium efflux system outer membrane protein
MSLGSKYKNIMKIIYINMLVLLMAGCAAKSPNEDASGDFAYISAGLEERTNYSPRQAQEPGKFEFPQWVTLDDGLSQDEAVALALWNNAQFQADLAALGFARADLLEANMLANPTFSLLFPIGPKALEMDMGIPVDILWQRPHRIAAARLNAQSLAEDLIKNGLGLIRDVQTTYTDLWLSQKRLDLAIEDTQLQLQITKIAQDRLIAGDINELEADNAYMDSLRATNNVKRLLKETDIFEQQLNTLLGFTSDNMTYDIEMLDITEKSTASIDKLLETALAARPDMRAIELAIEAAGERLGWEKSKIYNFIAIIDAKDEGEDSLTVGPGLEVEIPIFNQNQSQIAHAKAELEQASRQYEALRQNIIFQVRQAFTRYVSEYEEFELWGNDIIPSLENNVEQTTKSFEIGEVPYLNVLEAKRRLIEAKVQFTGLAANVHRTAAELNYCVGKKMI